MLRAAQIEKFLKKEHIPYDILGDTEATVDGYAPLSEVSAHKITWVKKWTPTIEERLRQIEAAIIVCKENASLQETEANCYFICENPKACYFEILNEFFNPARQGNLTETVIDETAVVKTGRIGRGCRIGAYCVVDGQAELGNNVVLDPHVTVIGKVKIGSNSVIHAGAVLGKAGFGYYKAMDGHQKRVPHLGGVTIGECVEIGANTCVDRGTLGDTVIGNHTKIDSLCIIAHNVQIGEDVTITGGVSISGSCRVGDNAYIAPGAVVKNQTELGRHTFVGMQSCVVRRVREGKSVFGVPARYYERDYEV